jgi:hypothetical protein
MAIDMRAAVKIAAGVTGAQAVDQLRTKMDRLGGVAGGLTQKFNMVKGALGALGAALAVREFAQFAQSAFNAADNLQKMSIRTGASVEDLSKLDQAAKMSGTSLESVGRGFTFLSRQMNEAATKGGETAEIFRSLGVQFKNSDGTLRDTNAVFADLADRFAEMPDGAQKVALGQKLIGKGFTELIPLINGGGDAIRNVSAIISTEFANRSALFNDTVEGMKNQTKGLINEGLNELLKSLQQILEVYKDVNADSETVKAVFNGIGIAVKGLVIAFDTLITGVRQAVAVLQYFGETLAYLFIFEFEKAKNAAGARLDEIATLGIEYQKRIAKLFEPVNVDTQATSGSRNGGRGVQLIDEEDLKRQADAADREIDRISKIFEKLREDQKRAAEEIKRQGQAVFEATRTPAEQLAAELDRLNKLLNAGAINWDTYSRAVFQAQDKFDDAMKKSKDTTKSLLEDIRDAAQGIGKQMTDAFVDFATTGKASVKDMANSIIADLARIMVQRMVTDKIVGAFSGFLGFANGGVMTARGEMPLKTYSRGGIANRPQVAVFGEGSQPEAYVPLPDGRRIPVAMQGGGTSTNNVTVNVNVATGQTDTSSTGSDAAQLGNVISKAVQGEILRQQRPGGLLYGA